MKKIHSLLSIGLMLLGIVLLSSCSTQSESTIKLDSLTTPGLNVLAGSSKPGDYEALMLAKINYLRKKGHSCQNVAFEATADLIWNKKLSGAAKSHVKDIISMTSKGELDLSKMAPPHEGSDGYKVNTRVTNQGYEFNTVAENLASSANGSLAMHATYLSWLASTEGHCEVLVRDDLTEIGLYFEDGIWAAVLGSPKSSR